MVGIFVHLDANDDDEIGPTKLHPEELEEIRKIVGDALADCGTVVTINSQEAAIINVNPL